MKPQRRFALSKRIGDTLAEAQLSTLDRPGTATALGAAARSGFKQVSHRARIIRLQHEATPIAKAATDSIQSASAFVLLNLVDNASLLGLIAVRRDGCRMLSYGWPKTSIRRMLGFNGSNPAAHVELTWNPGFPI
jgi:hypothetical protein